ncbi:TetR/AcrR family transcriptional regulator [Lentilactobacillus sp. Marseille-Q4993]|uniref:TetR/AcrR family transcriptional regulator n=1 Tax=Lentilactobacillus sp. Marseille-Q4993 TaxID=3039492 RepID=UPI0024BCE821|nr:TetR/AcrR family transcriptional regulator [Lentilactobacillus sp. Marseille-Q4993]
MASTTIESFFNDDINADENLPAKQKQVLKAALELFATKGFANTTTADIAEKANVSQGTVYKRYTTKEELLQATLSPLIERTIPKAIKEFTAYAVSLNQPSFEELLHVLLKNRFEFVSDNRKALKVMLSESLTNPKLLAELEQTFAQLLSSELPMVIDKFKSYGTIVDWETQRIIQYIVSIGFGYAGQIILLDRKFNADKAAADAANFIYRGLKK